MKTLCIDDANDPFADKVTFFHCRQREREGENDARADVRIYA